MDQIIILRKGGFAFRIPSKTSGSVITKASQHVEMLGADTVDISVQSAVKLNFIIGDYIEVIGRRYTLNTTPKEKKGSSRDFSYDLQFEGAQYDLLRANYSVNVDTTTSEIQDLSGDSLTGDIKIFLDVLVANLVRVFPSQWVLGSYPLNSETKTLTFSDSDNCLSVLQTICTDYETQFTIVTSGAVNTINIGEVGQIFPYTFEYGKGKGLYDLTNERVSSSNIITRLNVYGSSKNINTSKYRAFKLCLPTKTKGKSYLEDSTAIAKYGIWEDTKTFEEIYPHRTGTVTSVDSTVKFKDSTMDFDLNAKDANGTIHLIAGSGAKVHFNTGNLAGYEFDAIYDHATKAFTIKPFTDENGFTFPSETSAAFQFKLNDEYVILGIYLPQSYIDNAEAELQVKGLEHLAKFSQPNVQYSLNLDPVFLRDKIGSEVESNILWVGDFIPIKDSDLNVDKSIRVKGFTRDLLKDFAYSLTIADQTVSTSIINRIVSDIKGINNVVKINNLNDPARARRNYLNSQEVLDLIFDQEGDFYTEKIKPLSIDTSMLSVGAKYMQFGLVGTIFQPNYAGTKNRVVYTGGALTHYAILNGENPRTWNIASGDIVLSSDAAFYIYAKCLKSGTSGTILFSTTQILVEEDVNNYHFLIGIINSVGANNERAVALMYGFSAMNGRFIKTGRVQNADGSTYFDLDTGEISGKITFSSGSSGYANLADKPDLSVYSEKTYVDTITANLQAQVDGVVDSWFYAYSPTLANYPASEWTTDIIKDRHIGDTFTNTQEFVDNATTPDAGKSWRFVKNGSVYSWGPIADSDAVKALLAASQAQDTADGKRRTFTTQPTNADAYAVGDLWVNATYSTTYSNDILKCKTAKVAGAAFSISHWEKAGKYTDDTAADDAQASVDGLNISSTNIIANSSFNSLSIIPDRIITSLSAGNRLIRVDDVSADGYIAATFALKEEYVGKRMTFSVRVNANWTIRFMLRARCFSASLDQFSPYYITSNPERGLMASVTFTPDATSVTLYIYTESRVNLTILDGYMLVLGDRGQRWTPAPEDVQAEIDAYSYLKQALTGSTEVQGGLVGTNVLLLKTLAGITTGGFSGLSSDNVGFWTGGDYPNAIDSLAKVLFRKDGSGQLAGGKILWDLLGNLTVGDLAIDNSGAVTIKDAGGIKRIYLTRDNITTLAAIAGSTQNTTINNSSHLYGLEGTETFDFANPIVVNNNNSEVRVQATLSMGISADNSAAEGRSTFQLLLRNTATGITVSIDYRSLRCTGSSVSLNVNIDEIVVLQAGTYTLRMISSNFNTQFCSSTTWLGNSVTTVFFDGSTQRSEFGKNGIGVIGNATNYFVACVENGVFKVVEKTTGVSDRPGVLLSGRGYSSGGAATLWGAKKHATLTVSKVTTGVYTVYHSIGHTNYSVQVTPMDASRSAGWTNPETNSFTIFTYSGASLADTNFSFAVFGDN